MAALLLLVLYGLIVGIALGLSGGAGSIFAVPLLVYGSGVSVHQALLISLVVVGSTAFFGAFLKARASEVVFRAAAVMVLTGLVFAPCGALVSQYLSGKVLMVGFALLLFTVGIMMWRKAVKEESHRSSYPHRERHPLFLIVGGAVSGFLNGLFGVGGGFLIVPTLVFAASLPIRKAMATSLLVIGSVSAFSVLTHLYGGQELSISIIVFFLGGGIVGMTVGTAMAKKFESSSLHKGFAVMMIVVGVFILGREIL